MAVFELITTLICSGMVFSKEKGFHYISCLISLCVSAITSSYIWLENNLLGTMSGLFWESYGLTMLGKVVIAFSWVVTVIHAVAVALAYRVRGEQTANRKKRSAPWIAVIIGVLLLVVFQDVIIDFYTVCYEKSC